MINSFRADIICLQEVGCSNAQSAELQQNAQSEPLIGRTGELATKAFAQSRIDNVANVLKPLFLAENTEKRDKNEFDKMSAILKSKFLQPNSLNGLSTKLYSSPSKDNVRAIIIKKIKVPILEDLIPKVRDEKPKAIESNTKSNTREKQLLREIQELKQRVNHLQAVACSDTSLEQRSRDVKVDPKFQDKRLISDNQELKQTIKWLQEVASSNLSVEQRKRFIQQPKAAPASKVVGCRYFILVVIKSGILEKDYVLDYVIPELPIFKQKRVSVKIRNIISLNDESVDISNDSQVNCQNLKTSSGVTRQKTKGEGSAQTKLPSGNVRVVPSITVNQSTELESIAMLEVSYHFRAQHEPTHKCADIFTGEPG
jgi:hypothetical protein